MSSKCEPILASNFLLIGSVCGQGIADHPDVRKLGFTGSTPVGKTIMTSCAQSNLKKVSLELGGKSPLIIFADCDLNKAVRMVSSINGYFCEFFLLIIPASMRY